MLPFKLDHLAVISLRAGDVPATAHFYHDILGLPLLPHHGQRPALVLGNDAHLVIVARETSDPPFPSLAFAVEDLDRAVAHLQDHRVQLLGGVQENGQGRWIQFRDPAGNLIELVQFDKPLSG